MLGVAEKLVDKSFFLRLNTIPSVNDAVANEVKYHLKCWSSCKQLARKVGSSSLPVDESFATETSNQGGLKRRRSNLILSSFKKKLIFRKIKKTGGK